MRAIGSDTGALRLPRVRGLPDFGAVLVTAMGIAACSGSGDDPTTHSIAMRAFEFVPPQLTVRAGDTIVWANEDAVPHTATAASGAWDTGSVAGRESGRLAMETPGTHEYVCAFHPTMKGVVTVE